jgi:hypothetical protein
MIFSLIAIPEVRAASTAFGSASAMTSLQDQDQNQDQGQNPDQGQYSDQGQNAPYESFSPEQLDNLLSPIALYPDPLLAQVLVAATFPDQVEEAARWVRGNGQNGVDDQNWDVSVKAVAHYPTVIEMMADKIDWTTSLGQAYVNQSTDVSSSVQRLRHLARNVGNLQTTPQQEVLVNDDYIAIDPVQPQLIYVPVYDPAICYYRHPYYGPAIAFGVGFPIGAWLNLDFRWGFHGGYGGVFYHGWQPWGGWNARWMDRSRTVVRVNNVYINNRYTNITVNRTVINRTVNVNNINRYNYVHKNVTYNNVQINNARVNRFNNVRVNNRVDNKVNVQNNRVNNNVNNKILNRNIDTNNSRYNDFRGRENNGQRNDRPPQVQQRPVGNQNRPDFQNRPNPPVQQQQNRQTFQGRPAQVQVQRPPQNQVPHTFGRSEGNFDSRASSERGQASRQQASRPAPVARPAPAQRNSGGSSPAPHGGGGRRP